MKLLRYFHGYWSAMLIQNLIPGTIEGVISFVSNIASQDFSRDRIPGAETWQDCSHLDQQPCCGYMNFVLRREASSDASSSLNHSSLPISTSSTMVGNSAPLCVYRRRKHQQNSHAICPTQVLVNTKIGGGCNSSNSSDVHSGATKELVVSVEAKTEGIDSPFKLPVTCTVDGFVSKSGSSDECVHREDPCSEDALRNDTRRVLDGCGVDDSCSSSKFNLDVVTVSFKTDVEDTAQCSSSGVLLSERSWDTMSGKDFCIDILRSQGLLEEANAFHHLPSAVDTGANFCLQKCKVCAISETSLNMLICDSCEDAFHVKCCNPRIKRIPSNEWFCYSCLKKKHKMLKEKSANTSLNIDNECSGCRSLTSDGEIGPIEAMLRNIEPSKFTVRIGDKFQAEIPDWPNPLTKEVDPMGEPEEVAEPEYLNVNDQSSNKMNLLSSIGNWIQCQEVIEGIGEHVDGTTCGKWRRAPLFEVQTDEWECFRAVLWDPAHADCAVPQELPTEEVLRQLKYIEMLRPRLAAKRRKLDQAKTGGSEVRKQE